MTRISYILAFVFCFFSFGCDSGSDSGEDSEQSFLTQLIADDASNGAEFGKHVAVSGDYAIIGAPGDQDENGSRGAAYMFKREGEAWIQTTKLKRSDTNDGFGESVAIDGDYAIIGGKDDAFIFERMGDEWQEVVRLEEFAVPNGSGYGESVDINGNYAIVGAPRVSGRNVPFIGSVFIYERSGGSWSTMQKIDCRAELFCGSFGASVAISERMALVGIPAAFSDEEIDGAVSLYEIDPTGTEWNQFLRFTSNVRAVSADSGAFGASVALHGESAIVGGLFMRRAFLFESEAEDWGKTATFRPTIDGVINSFYGWNVAIGEEYAAVSDVTASADLSQSEEDAVHFFRRQGDTWAEIGRVNVSEVRDGDFFGHSLSISGSSLIVGAPAKRTQGLRSGAAYIIDIPKLVSTL
ncbi:MAG: FG-GAP repeat protein [Rhodothermaceae bacterium]|nr:FG-GAP repeat protein [Rhodothermaceae bacterium]